MRAKQFIRNITESVGQLQVGDPVEITGAVEHQGETGELVDIGRNGAFVVVNLYNHGKRSFHASDVSYNDYADSDEEEAEMYDRDPDARKWSLDESIGDGDDANAVVAEVIKLIGEGHTEVSPDVITTKVSAALGRPFMLKDLVACNNSSPELQHYIDSINPTKIKFSTDILTVKNQDPLKAKEQAQSGVASMAAKAANRPRLGEAVNKGVTSPEIKQAYNDIFKTEPHTPERKEAVDKYQHLRKIALDKKKQGVTEGGFFDPDRPGIGDTVRHQNGAMGQVKKIGTQGDTTTIYFKDANTGKMNFGNWKKQVFPVKQQGMAESEEGKVVFSGTGASGSKYEIIQSGPTDFMIHANGEHIDTYSSLQRAMSVLKNEVPGLQQGVAEARDPDQAYDDMRQQEMDDETERQQAKRPQTKSYTLVGRGPNMEPNYKFPGEYDSQVAADAARKKLMANPSTPNPRDIGITTHTRYLDEAKNLGKRVKVVKGEHAGAVGTVREIHHGAHKTAPKSYYVDLDNGKQANNMAGSDLRLVKESRDTPLRDREDYTAKKKALQDIQMDPHTHKDPELSTELLRRLSGLEQQRKDLK